MSKFNPKMLADLTKKIKEAKGGTTVLLEAKKMDRDVPISIRLLKPCENQGAEWQYPVEGVLFWINQKPYLSPATFGDPCPIREEIEKAKSLKSTNIENLLKDWKNFSEDTSYYMPIAHVDFDIDDNSGELSKVLIAGPERVLKAPISLLNDIHKIVINKNMMAGSGGQGIFHQKLGYAIDLLKTGFKKETKYSAVLAPVRVPLDDEHYNPFDIMAWFEKQRKPDEELRTAIRAYLYGEDDETGLEDTLQPPLKEKEFAKKEFKDLEQKKVDFSDPKDNLEMSLEEDFDLGDLSDL